MTRQTITASQHLRAMNMHMNPFTHAELYKQTAVGKSLASTETNELSVSKRWLIFATRWPGRTFHSVSFQACKIKNLAQGSSWTDIPRAKMQEVLKQEHFLELRFVEVFS